ncbi:flagellar assembly protein FliH [Bacillus sp. CLL-7-23]|uniref:Flagellar assembly protein FliH n=1 Tax=Bacillus changyiensis TaxID=3004103 RepID=A0ABT4X0N0_9BACI|nr:flagellar assembly protein FliH [Bacillus changyiensis]MDA7025864.1 flagellar assembly protein FliH [Bacillus changyiensis]
MISLSNIIKQRLSSIPEEKRRTISIKEVKASKEEEELLGEPDPQLLLHQAKQEANQLLEKANLELEQTRRQIDEEKTNWDTERQALIEQAKKEGFEAGFEHGKADAHKTYQSYLENANAIVSSARQDYEEKIEQSAEEIITLAVSLAKKVWHQKPDDKAAFIELVKQVLSEIKEFDDISIYVDPEYYEMVRSQKNELQQLLQYGTHLAIYADEKAVKGTCYIETAFGRIDASIDTQLEQLKQKLLALLETAGES